MIAICEKRDYLERSMKVDDLFLAFNSNLAGIFCQAETEPPFKKSWIRYCLAMVQQYHGRLIKLLIALFEYLVLHYRVLTILAKAEEKIQ